MRMPRIRLSVRVSMILVLVVGGGLGWVVLRAREQRQAVEAILAARGQVLYDWQVNWGPFAFSGDGGGIAPGPIPEGPALWPGWLVDRLGPDYFSHPEMVVLDGGNATDAVMSQVGRLDQLEILKIVGSGPGLSNGGISHIQNLPRLKQLTILLGDGNGCVTGSALAYLASGGRLKQLTLSGVPMRDVDLALLGRVPDLRQLMMQNCGITDAGMAPLGRLTELRFLILSKNPVTDTGLCHLSPMAELRSLDLNWTGVRGHGLAQLRGLKGLNYLNLEDTPLEEPSSIAELVGLTGLTLRGCPIDDPAMGVLSRMTRLKSLVIDRSNISDVGLAHMAGMGRLDYVTLSGCKVTPAGVAALQATRPKMIIKQ